MTAELGKSDEWILVVPGGVVDVEDNAINADCYIRDLFDSIDVAVGVSSSAPLAKHDSNNNNSSDGVDRLTLESSIPLNYNTAGANTTHSSEAEYVALEKAFGDVAKRQRLSLLSENNPRSTARALIIDTVFDAHDFGLLDAPSAESVSPADGDDDGIVDRVWTLYASQVYIF